MHAYVRLTAQVDARVRRSGLRMRRAEDQVARPGYFKARRARAARPPEDGDRAAGECPTRAPLTGNRRPGWEAFKGVRFAALRRCLPARRG